MGDLDAAIIAEFDARDDAYWLCRNLLEALLKLHADGDGHTCVKEHEGYTVTAWYGPGELCPTKLAIAKALGVTAE